MRIEPMEQLKKDIEELLRRNEEWWNRLLDIQG
jgi:hypothetical protein